MGRSAVMLFVTISTITIIQVWGACVDFTCTYNPPKGDLKETITVDQGDKCGYYTQPGDSYPPPKGVNCIVKYKMGTCNRVKFHCESLYLWNKDDVPWRCNKGDKMIIYGHLDGPVYRETKKYCRHRAPKRVRSTEGLKVRLLIERHTKGGRGGENCYIKCIELEDKPR